MGQNNYTANGKTPPPGIDSREKVADLQRKLNENGANLVVDGIYGNKTDAAYEQIGSSSGSGSGGSSGRSSGGSSGGYGQHKSGYVGPIMTGQDGNSYTEYGALLREDGFYYPQGAKISPNGMYFDIGNGWQFAKYGVAFDSRGNVLDPVPNSMTYAAPGTRISGFEGAYARSSGGGNTDADTDSDEEEELSIWEKFFDEQLKKHEEELYAGYGQ
ncbi:MAG: hypothetical protein AAGU77_06235 [Bacillota bacterium]